jgi:hypothetical protein
MGNIFLKEGHIEKMMYFKKTQGFSLIWLKNGKYFSERGPN